MSAIHADTSVMRETARTLEGLARSVENVGAALRSGRGAAWGVGIPRPEAAVDALVSSALARLFELSAEARNLGRVVGWAAARYESVEDAAR